MKTDYRQWTRPVVIGSGQRLLREGTETSGLRLLDRQAFIRDVIVVSYAPVDVDDTTPPLFEDWSPATSGSISRLAMAMLGVSSESTPDQDR